MKSPFSQETKIYDRHNITADDYKTDFQKQGKVENYFVEDGLQNEISEIRNSLKLITLCLEQEQQIKELNEELNNLKRDVRNGKG